MRVPLALATVLVAATILPALAQTAPPTASIEIERGGLNGRRVVVRCAPRDSTRDCAELATAIVDKANATPATK